MIKAFGKRFFYLLGVIGSLPLILITWLEALLLGRQCERVFGSCKELLSIIPTFVGDFMRLGYYSAVCTHVSPDAVILFGSMIAHRDTILRRGVVVGVRTIIGKADIGENVLFGAGVALLSGKYQHGRPQNRGNGDPAVVEFQTIAVGRNSWIGEKAVIMANIGENCTISAGAVLMKDAPDNATFMGNPARKVNVEPAKPAVPPVTESNK